MPIISYPEETIGLGSYRAIDYREKPTEEGPSGSDLIAAAFRQDNVVGSFAANKLAGINLAEREDGFTGDVVWGEIEGTPYEEHWDRFAAVFNRQGFNAMKAQIDMETEDRRTLQAGGWAGVAASLGAGVLDPINLIPVGGTIARAATTGKTIARAALSTAGAGAVSAGLAEIGLQSTQQTRPFAESVIAVGGGALLGGLLGAGVGKVFTKAERAAAMNAVEKALRSPDASDEALRGVEAGMREGASAGAAAVERDTLEDLTISGKAAQAVGKSVYFMNPVLRASQSPSVAHRTVMSNLAETGYYLEKNAQGRGNIAVESAIKFWDRGVLSKGLETTNEIYREARKGGLDMTATEFREAVSMAMRRGDEGPNEAVTKAARAWRSILFDPLKVEAINTGLLPADVHVSTAVSYLTRLWNSPYLNANEGKFKSIVRPWLDDQLRQLEFKADEIRIGNQIVDAEKRREVFSTVSERLEGIDERLSQRADVRSRKMAALSKMESTRLGVLAERAPAALVRMFRGADETASMVDVVKQARAAQRTAAKKKPASERQPVLSIIRAKGGVRIGSFLDGELNAMGVTPKSHPGLFRKGRGLGDVDNFVKSEEDVFALLPEDANGYVERDAIFDAIRSELSGSPLRTLKQVDEDAALENIEQVAADWLQQAGLPENATVKQVRDHIARVMGAEENLSDFDTRIANLEREIEEFDKATDAINAERAITDAEARSLEDQIGKLETAIGLAKDGAAPRELVPGDFYKQPINTLDELYSKAAAHQQELEEVGRGIARDIGAVFKSSGIKARATSEEKMARKGYRTAARLTDVVRGGFVVNTPAQAEDVISRLAERFDVLDEGWKETSEGYFDRKALVRFEGGAVGEIQLWEPRLLAAKKGEGHKLYREWRSLAPTSARAVALKKRMREVYAAAMSAEDRAGWIAARSSEPNSGSNLARQAPSDITPAVWDTSAKSTLDQDSPGSSTANAPAGLSSNKTPGRASQSTNSMGEISFPVIIRQASQRNNIASSSFVRDISPRSKLVVDYATTKRDLFKRKLGMRALQRRVDSLKRLEAEGRATDEMLAELSAKEIDLGRMGATIEGLKAKADKLEPMVPKVRQELPDFVSPEDRAAYLDEIADDIFRQLTGRASMGAPSYDMTIAARGPLKERTFNIPDELVEEFLENDVELIARRYARIMSADVELARKFGKPTMADQIQDVATEYQRLREAVTNSDMAPAAKEKELQRLAALEKRDVNDIAGIRDVLRGQYRPDVQHTNFARVLNSAMTFNYVRLLGGVLFSSLTDAVRPAMVHGLGRYMNEGIRPLVANLKAVKLAASDAKFLGAVTERVLQSRLATMAELADPYAMNSPFERFIANTGNVFSRMTLLPFWNDMQKSVSSALTQNRVLSNALRDFDSLAPAEKSYMGYLGLDRFKAERIAEQFKKFGDVQDGVHIPGVERWTDPEAVRMFAAAVNKDVDTTIVTKGAGDVPLFMNTPLGRAFGQFKSFALASNQRVLMRGLQEGVGNFAVGVMGMTALGMLVYWLKQVESGRELSDNPGTWMAEGLDRTGIFALAFEINGTWEKLGGPGLYYLAARGGRLVEPGASLQGRASRYATRNAFGALLGPSFQLGTDTATLLGLGASGLSGNFDPSAGDVTTGLNMIPGRNLPYFKWLLEGGFGINEMTGGAFRGVRPEMQEAVQ